MAGEDERRHRRLRRPPRPRPGGPLRAARDSRLPPAGRRVGAPPLRPRLGRPARRRRRPDRGDEDPARARAGRGAAGSHRALVRHGRRGGQRRRRPPLPDGPRPARRPPRARPRRRRPHRGHRRLEEGRPRDLPRPARADADRGRGDRPLLPRLDAVGGPEPPRARGRDRGRGGAALRRARGLPRPPVPRARHAHRVLGAARHAERLRGAGAAHVPLRPPAHGRRDAGAGGARRGGARRGARPRGRPAFGST